MNRHRGLRHDEEAEEGAKELVHLEVGWTARRWIQHEAVSVQTVVISIVRSLDQEGQHSGLQLFGNVVERLAEGTSCVDTALADEVG